MANHERRIRALEKVQAARWRTWQAIRRKALPWPEDIELLICADGAERFGIPLSDRELAARQTYVKAVESMCGQAGFRPPTPSECKIDLRQSIHMALRGALKAGGDWDAYLKAARACERGIELDQEQECIIQCVQSGWYTLHQLAGFRSPAEYELLCEPEHADGSRERQFTLAAGAVPREITPRTARLEALQDNWDRMRLSMEERGVAMPAVAGSKAGLLVCDSKREDAAPPRNSIDTGMLAELRAQERHAAQELGPSEAPKLPVVCMVAGQRPRVAHDKPVEHFVERERPDLPCVVLDLIQPTR